jgi:DNA polymerase I-like protein with 3'-5' exonuclease and polymerase domains
MVEAYDRERQLMPILLENEREGVRVDLKMLRADVKVYQDALATVEAWMRKRLKASTLNFNDDEGFAQALADNKLVDEHRWVYTPKSGKRSVSKKNLTPDMVNDQRVAQAYGYRNRLVTCLGTFMLTWLRQAEATYAKTRVATIHTLWKQVKASSAGGSEEGAATSRLSSSPNFQNIIKDLSDKGDGYVHPAWLKVPELPLLRKYILPDEGHVLLDRDWDGQELRLLAHFSDGAPEWSEVVSGELHIGPPVPGEMLHEYNTNPTYKVHKVVHNGIGAITGHEHTYQAVKNFDFQVVYGGGVPAVSAALKVDRDVAVKAIEAFKILLPDYDRLNTHIKNLAKVGEFITTWGGIRFHKEPDHYSEEYGRWMDFGYKLLNYLIQGSAAQCIKEAIIRYHNHPKRQARFMLSVHDEFLVSCPKHRVKEEMLILRECMESLELDLLLKSEGKTGLRWSELKDYPEERKAA